MKRSHFLILLGAILLGLFVRIPGIFWGYNFPTGWQIHHIDEWTHLVAAETIIEPTVPARWYHPYLKGTAAHAAIPFIVFRALQGEMKAELPEIVEIVVLGRVISVIYGTATIVFVYFLAKRLFRDWRVAALAAWLFALGGLHITQSHFFLADVPSLFWLLLGLYLLLLELETPDKNSSLYLMAAAFCLGVAFGIKFVVAALPSLAIIALIYKPRLSRMLQIAAFFIAGFFIVNFASYTPLDFFNLVTEGTNDPYQYNRFVGLLLYAIELPSIVSFPVTLLAVGSSVVLVKDLFIGDRKVQNWSTIILIVFLPLLISFLSLTLLVDHFPRHFIPFIPWISMLAAWGLIQLIDYFKLWGLRPALIIIPVIIYLLLFVYDGERVFLKEPRNAAAKWIQENVEPGTPIYWYTPDGLEGYPYIHFPEEGRPSVLAIQMDDANHYLSGIGLRDSYPSNYQNIFDSESQARVEGLQAVFKGTSEYIEVTRFKEDYFMPEYKLVDSLIGNRSRNYVAEIVVFTKGD